MNSQAARFFLYEKWLKSWKKAEKKGKIKRKKLQKNLCLGASTWREEMPLIKVAYFMLNFLNLKSFLSYLFFIVASSLSTLCKRINYSCNNTTMTWIQISLQNWNGFFSNISHQDITDNSRNGKTLLFFIASKYYIQTWTPDVKKLKKMCGRRTRNY